jgi:hypothetical protein
MNEVYSTLKQIEEKPLFVMRGTESNHLRRMVENGLLEQTAVENGEYKFSLTAIGFFALDQVPQNAA